jgi:hypothetical protein
LLLTNLASSKGKAIDVGLMSPYFVKHIKKDNNNNNNNKCIEERDRKNCIDTRSSKVFLEVSPINRRHGVKTLMIQELICTTIKNLFNNKWSFPLWLELFFRLVCDDDGTSKNEYKFTFLKDSLFD